MTLPHKFPSICGSEKQVLVIAGAGLSVPNIPAVSGLKPRVDEIASDLRVAPSADFYELSDRILNELRNRGLSESESRLKYAELLGLLDDAIWFGSVGLPLRGNTPRHRAIARLAVEERIRAVVSLNWDGLLEAGLESVGLSCDSRPPRPWKKVTHRSVVRDSDLPTMADAAVFPVFKPHGCVRDLSELRRLRDIGAGVGEVIFKLTSADFAHSAACQNLIDRRIESLVAECPLIAVSWKADEPSLRRTVLATALATHPADTDSFTLASRSWYATHDEIAEAYGKVKASAFTSVGNAGDPTLDDLFQWLLARFVIARLSGAANDPDRLSMAEILDKLDVPRASGVTNWVDSWLPVWIRLCWRVGAMIGCDPSTNRRIDPWDIPIMPRDLHVPVTGMAVERHDLAAAAKLLAAIERCIDQFDFDLFPGGLYRSTDQLLIVPLPGWRAGSDLHDLAGLKPLVEAMEGFGYVRSIRLLWLDPLEGVEEEAQKKQLRALFVAQLSIAKFASGDGVEWWTVDELRRAVS